MIAAAVILVFSGMHLMKKAYNQQQVPVAENTQAVDPVQKPQEIQTGREQDLQKDVSNGRIQLWKSGIEIWKTSPGIWNRVIPAGGGLCKGERKRNIHYRKFAGRLPQSP